MVLMALGLVDTVTSEIPINQSSTENVPVKIDNDIHNSGSNDLPSTYAMKVFGNFVAAQCGSSYSFQPLYYHIGCAFFLLAFLAPSYRYGPALYMRCTLIFGCILFLMWSYLVECRPDVLIWTLLFLFVNLIHMAILICKLRPVKFEKEIEEVSKSVPFTFFFTSSLLLLFSFQCLLSSYIFFCNKHIKRITTIAFNVIISYTIILKLYMNEYSDTRIIHDSLTSFLIMCARYLYLSFFS